MLMVYTGMLADKSYQSGPIQFFLLALIPCYLGTVFSDLDITLLGIGSHRNPLFHSSLSYLVLYFLLRQEGRILRIFLIGYGVGLASHLWWDVVYYGDVRWLPGSTLDRLWLAGNGLLCFIPPSSRQKNSMARFSAQ